MARSKAPTPPKPAGATPAGGKQKPPAEPPPGKGVKTPIKKKTR